MASAAVASRLFTGTGVRVSSASKLTRISCPRATFRPRQQGRRGFADSAPPKSSANNGRYIYSGLAATAAALAGYYAYNRAGGADAMPSISSVKEKGKAAIVVPKKADYQAVYNEIAKRLEEHDEYEDGSYGPVIVRLAWHCSGTYDKETGTGGSNGATMRFAPESDHGANAGLRAARDFLEPVKGKYPWITYSDLWTLAGVAAIQEMHGPVIPWRPGRSDRELSFCTPDGRLPDAAKGSPHLRSIFGRMGFSDQEIVALSGAHALGRCHTDRSGFDGPWTFSPTLLSNDYFRLLLDEKWLVKKWDGPKQFQDAATKSLMMLPTDMALVQDKLLKPHVERYAKDQDAFFADFSAVVAKLFELGVPFTTGEEAKIRFKPTRTD